MSDLIKLIDQKVEFITTNEELDLGLKRIEKFGRVCYQSMPKDASGDHTKKFIQMLIGKHHESVLEHCSLSFLLTTSRSVTHQLVRHRLCAFSQESQRYCNYALGKFNKQIQVIKPIWFDDWNEDAQKQFINSMEIAAVEYFKLLECGCRPEEARDVLPNACKTQIAVTVNLREFRHILKERCSKAAQAQIRQLALTMRACVPEFLIEDIPACTTDGDRPIFPAELIF